MRTGIGILICCLALFASSKLKAQHDLTLYNMDYLPQIFSVNPAKQPVTRWYFGVSGYGSAGNTGMSYNDVIARKSGDTAIMDLNRLYDRMNKKNHLLANGIGDVGFGFKISSKTYLNFGVAEKVTVKFTYPRDFFGFFIKGNGSDETIGKEMQIGGFRMNASHYREYAIGASHRVNCDLAFGVRLKRLYGMENVSTRKSYLSLTTDPTTFALTAKSDINIQTSGLLDSAAFKQFENDRNAYLFKRNNHGWGLDLGATYVWNDINFSASILDLGYITWQDYNFALKSKQPGASYTFTGVDARQWTNRDSTNKNYFDNLTDSVIKQFNVDTIRAEKYRTGLNGRLYLSANIQITKKTWVGGMFYSEFYNRGIRPAISLMVKQNLGKVLQVQINYSTLNRSLLNLGFGFALNMGPIQTFIVSDNGLGMLLSPKNTQTAHVRVGLNIGWWYAKDCKNPCSPDLEKCRELAEERRIKRLKKLDTDKDGIFDYYDSCVVIPGLPQFNGCPDVDGDGIIDDRDSCPVVAGVLYFNGCPDSDRDSIQDKDDKCPNNWGPLKYQGCPDSDGDGLIDLDDKCPLMAGPLENNGCPWGDRDSDGVTDNIDKCPDLLGLPENQGCPDPDTDGDGVLDKNDECPLTPGSVENKGCPIIEKADQEILNTAFDNLEFETGKTIIRASSFESLDQLAALLIKKPDYRLRISGHTDNVGNAAANMQLSKGRAMAVEQYLLAKGVNAKQLKSEWFGITKPIASNTTAEDRQKNRRVEMNVLFD